MHIGDRIRSRREELGMSQQELAKRAGYSTRSAIAKIEKGVSDITSSKLIEIANALQTTVSYLVNGEKYYLNEETEKIAQEAYDNPDMKSLFDMSRKMSPERLKAHLEFMEKLQNEEKQK